MPREKAESTGNFLDYRNGRLCVEGRPLSELVERLGTPFFLISETRLRLNYLALATGLSESGAPPILRYCAKANHEAAVLETLARCGSHLLASHPAEVELALRCGFSPGRIAYARPVLTPDEVDSVLRAGVEMFHAHRPPDLALLAAAGARAGRRLRVSLRLRQTGFVVSPLDRLSRRLGFDHDEALEACRQYASSPSLEPWAINFYLGTQQSHLEGFAKMFKGVLALMVRIAAETGVAIREVNLGGGLPSPSLQRIGPSQVLARWRDRPAPVDRSGARRQVFAERVAGRYRELLRAAPLPVAPVLAAEPGRSIVGDAVILVTRVHGVEGGWALLDASRSFLPESPLLFARRILPLAEPGPGKAERFYNLSGSSLNTLDVLDFRRRLPRLEPGDALAFCDAGAYSISRASAYAGMPPAVHLLAEDGGLRLVRRAGAVDDLLHPMIPMPPMPPIPPIPPIPPGDRDTEGRA